MNLKRGVVEMRGMNGVRVKEDKSGVEHQGDSNIFLFFIDYFLSPIFPILPLF